MHPGGPKLTQLALDLAQVRVGERILEVGCGTGVTTRVLVDAGASVTVVEKSEYMLAAMERGFRQVKASVPQHILGDVATCERLKFLRFDVALCECVIGFINDKQAL